MITLLRKEKKISQKQAAEELEISQALLSHYEKGIRECGLEFLVKIAAYYGVSCDYLLGKTSVRESAELQKEKAPRRHPFSLMRRFPALFFSGSTYRTGPALR